MKESKEERNSYTIPKRSEVMSISEYPIPGQIIDSFKIEKQDKCKGAQLVTNNYFARNVHRISENYKLHIAARNNDINAINFCIVSNYNFDAQDASIDTPLLIAIIYKNYEAARVIRQAHVHFLIEKSHGPTVASYFLYPDYKYDMQVIHTKLFVSEMVNKNFDSVRIGKVLAELNCNLNEIVEFQNSVMTKTYLKFCNKDIVKLVIPIPEDMYGFDFDHIRVLINCEPESKRRKSIFVSELATNICNYKKSKDGRNFIKKLSRWEYLDDEFFEMLDEYFSGIFMRKIKIFIKYGFHDFAKLKYGRNMMSKMFGNYDDEVISWLKKQHINVDKRYSNNNSLLHIAINFGVTSNVELLLNKYANPNVCNDDGDTPLSLALRVWGNRFYCKADVIKLLLIGGANLIKFCNKFDHTFFDIDPNESISDHDMDVVRVLVARLAIYEADGQSVGKPMKMLKMIKSQVLDEYLKGCRKQLEELKAYEISNTFNVEFSIFRVLVGKPEKLARNVNKKSLKKIKNFMKNNRNSLDAYYIELLKRQVKVISEIRPCRMKAIQAVCKLTGIKNPDHLIVEKIVEYFTVRDLLIFNSKIYRFFRRKRKVNIFE